MKWMTIGMTPQMMKIMDMNRRIGESMPSFPDFILCCFLLCHWCFSCGVYLVFRFEIDII